MLGLGWGEMLVIGVIALIVIGPKDLPVVMHNVGKVIGQIRRMGSEFQRELNKTTGLDEVRNLRRSITDPLRQTSEDIRREFNKMTPTGVQPSGALKPSNPGSESVVEEIRAAAGMQPSSDTVESVERAPASPDAKTDLASEADPRHPPSAPVKAVPTATRPAITTTATTGTRPDAAPAKPARKATAKKTSSELLKDASTTTVKPRRKVAAAGDATSDGGGGLPPPPPKTTRKPRSAGKSVPAAPAPDGAPNTETE